MVMTMFSSRSSKSTTHILLAGSRFVGNLNISAILLANVFVRVLWMRAVPNVGSLGVLFKGRFTVPEGEWLLDVQMGYMERVVSGVVRASITSVRKAKELADNRLASIVEVGFNVGETDRRDMVVGGTKTSVYVSSRGVALYDIRDGRVGVVEDANQIVLLIVGSVNTRNERVGDWEAW